MERECYCLDRSKVRTDADQLEVLLASDADGEAELQALEAALELWRGDPCKGRTSPGPMGASTACAPP